MRQNIKIKTFQLTVHFMSDHDGFKSSRLDSYTEDLVVSVYGRRPHPDPSICWRAVGTVSSAPWAFPSGRQTNDGQTDRQTDRQTNREFRASPSERRTQASRAPTLNLPTLNLPTRTSSPRSHPSHAHIRPTLALPTRARPALTLPQTAPTFHT